MLINYTYYVADHVPLSYQTRIEQWLSILMQLPYFRPRHPPRAHSDHASMTATPRSDLLLHLCMGLSSNVPNGILSSQRSSTMRASCPKSQRYAHECVGFTIALLTDTEALGLADTASCYSPCPRSSSFQTWHCLSAESSSSTGSRAPQSTLSFRAD
jgi:hypothetical protein